MAHRRQRLEILGTIWLLAACGDDVSQVGTDGSSSSTGVDTSGPGSASLPIDTTTGMSGTGSSSGGTESLDGTATTDTTTSDSTTGGSTTGDSTTGDSTTGDSTTGDTTTTGTTTDDPTTGDPTTGDLTTGSVTTGDFTTGDFTSGDPTTGDPTTGDFTTGGPLFDLPDPTTGGDDELPAWVGMSGNDSVMIFSQLTHTILDGPISVLPSGDYPYDVTIRPDGAEVWIAGASGDGIVVLDTITNAVLYQGGFSTGGNTYAVDVAFSLDGSTAYVAARDADALILVDTTTYAELSVSPTPGGNAAGKMTVNPCTGQVYVVEWYGDNLMTYDPGTGLWATVDLGTASLWDLVVDSSGSTLYVADRGNDDVHVFDVSGGVLPSAVPAASVNVGDDPWGIDITSDGATVVVACEDDHTVHFIDTATLTTSSIMLAADADPRDVDITADDVTAYVPNGDVAGNDGVYAIDIAGQVVVDTIALAPATNSNALAVTPQAVTCVP